jgi:hypothetical protein
MPLNRGLNRFSGPGQPGGFPWRDRVNAVGTLDGRPAAAPHNTGFLYLATDTAGGTLYRSNGSSWAATGAGVTATGSGGTVTSVSVTTANGVSGSVATATTTPAITLTLGAITPSSVAATGTGSFTLSDAGTASAATVLTLDHKTSGTPAGGFGLSLAFLGETTTTESVSMGELTYTWSDATHATRKSQGKLTAYAASTLKNCIEWGSDASGNAGVGFLNVGVKPQQTGDAGTALVAFGLMSGTPTFASANLTGRTTNNYIILRDEKASGSNGGSAVSGSFGTRTLNTESVDTGGDCTLSANQFTLTAGTYRITARAPAFNVGEHQIKLRNVTDGSDVCFGSSAYSGGVQTDSVINGYRFTIAGSKAFELQHRATTATATNGWGAGNAFGTQVFAEVQLEKEAS